MPLISKDQPIRKVSFTGDYPLELPQLDRNVPRETWQDQMDVWWFDFRTVLMRHKELLELQLNTTINRVSALEAQTANPVTAGLGLYQDGFSINVGTANPDNIVVNDNDIDLVQTLVAPGTYGSTTQVGQFTVDAYGRITGATNITISGSALSGVVPLDKGGTNKDLSTAPEGGIVYKDLDSFEVTDALTGILQGNGPFSPPTAITGTANYLPKWSATAPYLTSTSLVYDSGTFVGINTALPVTELTVVSTSSSDPRGIMSAQYSADTNGARLHFRKARGTEALPAIIVTGDVLGRIRFSGYDGANYLQMASIDVGSSGTVGLTQVPTYMTFSTATNASPSVLTEAMRINSSQNIGIGTSAPAATVHIVRDFSSAVRIDVYSNTASSEPQWLLTRGRGDATTPLAVQNGDSLGQFIFRGVSPSLTNAQAANFLVVVDGVPSGGIVPGAFVIKTNNGTANAERVRVSALGALGVGSSSPDTRLHVAVDDAATITTTTIAKLAHSSTGTPGTSFGATLLWALESTTTANQDAGAINVAWTTATHASRAAAMFFQTVTGAASLATVMALSAAGGLSVGDAIATMPNGVVNVATGFRVGLNATSGSYLRGDGTNIVLNAGVPTTDITGVMPIANGGTNKALTLVPGGVVWTDSDSFEVTVAGTAGQVLTSNGAAAPTWSTPVVISGTDGYFPYWQAGVPLSANSQLYQSGSLVGAGTASPLTRFHVEVNDLATNTVTNVLTVGHVGNALPQALAGFGVGIDFNLDSTTQRQEAAQIAAVWSDPTNATRTAYVTISTVKDGTLLEGFRTSSESSTFTVRDAVTNTVTDAVRVTHLTSGTPAANYGTGIVLAGSSDTTPDRDMARIRSIWTVAADATRTSSFQIQTVNSAAALATIVTVTGTGRVGVRQGSPTAFLHVPWNTGDTVGSIIGGSTTAGSDQIGVSGNSNSSIGGVFTSVSGIGSQQLTQSNYCAEYRRNDPTTTNAEIAVLKIRATTQLTPANGFGIRVDWVSHSTGSNNRDVAREAIVWTDVTDATRSSEYRFSLVANAVTTEVLRITSAAWMAIGTGGNPDASLHVRASDAATTTVTTVAKLAHTSSGTPGAAFGGQLLWALKSSTTANLDAGAINVAWTTATHASRTSAMYFQTVNNAAALATVMALSGAGGLSVGDATDTIPVGVINAVTGYRVNNAATTARLLRGNGTNIVLAQAALTTDVTGILPLANGGTATATTAANSVAFVNSTNTALVLNSADFFYTDSLDLLSLGTLGGGPWTGLHLYNYPASPGATDNVQMVFSMQSTGAAQVQAVNFVTAKEQNWTGGALDASQDASFSIQTALAGTLGNSIQLRSSGSVVCGKDGTGTGRVDDFLYFTSTAGVPAGTIEEYGARAALTYNTSSNSIYIYNPTDNAWHTISAGGTVPTGGTGKTSYTDKSVIFYNASTGFLDEDPGLFTYNISTRQLQVRRDNILITQSDTYGLLLTNEQPALAGAANQQWSPPVVWAGQGWDGAATKRVEYRAYVATVLGSGNPTGYWVLDRSIDNGTYVELMRADSTGYIKITKDALGAIDQTAALSAFGLHIHNDTPATNVITTQDAPPIQMKCAAWNSSGSASQDWRWRFLAKGVTVAGTTRSYLRIDSRRDGNNFGNPVVFSSDGGLSVGALIEAAFGVVSTQVGFQIAGGAASGQFLVGNGTNFVATTVTSAGNFSHAMLSATHTDTTASAVARGALITGQGASPTWTKLVIGAANRLLRSDGTDVSWAQAALATDVTGLLPLANGGTNANITAAHGQVVYSNATQLALTTSGTAGQVLLYQGVGAAPIWSSGSPLLNLWFVGSGADWNPTASNTWEGVVFGGGAYELTVTAGTWLIIAVIDFECHNTTNNWFALSLNGEVGPPPAEPTPISGTETQFETGGAGHHKEIIQWRITLGSTDDVQVIAKNEDGTTYNTLGIFALTSTISAIRLTA